MTTAEKLALLRIRQPLNASADEMAIERYFAAVIEDADGALLEDLACTTFCLQIIEALRRSELPVDVSNLTAMLAVIEVMEA